MKVVLQSGEDARLDSLEGNVLTMLSPRAFAPGSPMRFTASLEEGERGYEGRAIGSKRATDNRFEVRMRFVNLKREDREALLRAL
jgi:hypothetical protein